MSSNKPTNESLETPSTPSTPSIGPKADSLAVGLMFMLGVTVVQRLVGFGRSILFCGMLGDDQLGRWSLAFSFLVLAAPLAVIGLPGSFGRYVEYYRQRGQLGTFLRRSTVLSMLVAGFATLLIASTSSFWAWLVFGDPRMASMVRLISVSLAAVIIFNFVTELLTALRQVRLVAIMRFVSSLLFALLGVGLLYYTALGERAVIIAIGLSSLIAVCVAIGPLRKMGREAADCRADLPHTELWAKLLPFAGWVWMSDLLGNMFDAADRFMIIHFAKVGSQAAESLVGQYHSSRVIPFLLFAVASMVAGILLPYMSHDWERGDRKSVRRNQLLTLKLGGLALTALGALILLAAPLLFTWMLRGKYNQGLAVLPLTMTYCIWFSLTILVEPYLWCVEKSKLGSLALLIGLAVNIGLNVVLLPILGLVGAVTATTIANAVALAIVLYYSWRWGLRIDVGTVICCALPVSLVMGPMVGLAALLAVGYVASVRGWLFSEREQRELILVVHRAWLQFRVRFARQSLDYS